MQKGFLRNFTKFTRKHLCQSLFFKKETLAQVLPCKFCKIFRKPFLKKTSGRLLLNLLKKTVLLLALNFFSHIASCPLLCVVSTF